MVFPTFPFCRPIAKTRTLANAEVTLCRFSSSVQPTTGPAFSSSDLHSFRLIAAVTGLRLPSLDLFLSSCLQSLLLGTNLHLQTTGKAPV
ncbi:hypothetical protein L1987_17667 [Smallanthus sonchifolius]|uniref:Uncharacterized protein n=1 Tax=Smallanthus sonchifolius TaxID=185202 RepID=A0ACB9IY54_9ASTR|nr:hypothetical protein L1987_17667 [Smallanthus sonchifolius]